MAPNTLRRLSAVLVLALVGTCAVLFGSAAFAAMSSDRVSYVLLGTGPFSRAAASATVTRLSGDRFSLTLTADHLPPPTQLHVKFDRHAYVAWLVDGEVMHGPLHMAAVGLAATCQRGTYTGKGTVAIGKVTSVIITAEPTAQAQMPIMPVLTVLASAGRQL